MEEIEELQKKKDAGEKLSKRQKTRLKNLKLQLQRENEPVPKEYIEAYKAGKLSLDVFSELPYNRRVEYYQQEIPKKYKFDKKLYPKDPCYTCAQVALFKDNGYISDEELIKVTKLRHV